ncbi:MAG: PIN domain-containing protein [Phormidesmis sp.]
MGILDQLRGSRIYLDANIWIYALENFAKYSRSLQALLEATDAGILTIVTSELSLSEILVKPYRETDVAKQKSYTEFLVDTTNVTALPIERDILISAAKIRANTKLKLPDAIHAASAMASECTTFLTNDKAFQTVPGLHVVLLSQAAEKTDSD